MKGMNPKWNNNHFTNYTRLRSKRKSIQFNDWIEWNGKERKETIGKKKRELKVFFKHFESIDCYCLCSSVATHK